jgi:hypothetical protein
MLCILYIYKNMIFIFILEKLGHIHINKKLLFVFFQNMDFLFFCICFLKFLRKTSVFNIGSVSYNISL